MTTSSQGFTTLAFVRAKDVEGLWFVLTFESSLFEHYQRSVEKDKQEDGIGDSEQPKPKEED